MENDNGNVRVTLREFVERVFVEHEKLYDVRLNALEESFKSSLAAQEKLNTTIFSSNDKAITKAEEAQREYNIRSNNFRGQLDDQAKALMPRIETVTIFKAIDEKINALEISVSNHAKEHSMQNEKNFDRITKDITDLRDARSEFRLKSGSYDPLIEALSKKVEALDRAIAAGHGLMDSVRSMVPWAIAAIAVVISLMVYFKK